MVRQYAADLLDQLGWQASDAAAEAAYCVARRQWDRCVEIGAPAVRSLSSAVASEKPSYNDDSIDYNDRTEAARTLGRIGDPAAVETLCAALADNTEARYGPSDPLPSEVADRALPRVAAWALAEIGDGIAVKPLCDLLDRDQAPVVKDAAARAMVRLYRSGRLDQAAEELILSRREALARAGQALPD
jgi:HEAT repeat protein